LALAPNCRLSGVLPGLGSIALSSNPEPILVDGNGVDDIGKCGKAITVEDAGDDDTDELFRNIISRDTKNKRRHNDGRIVDGNTEFFLFDIVRGFIVAGN
jgi:hypothetical protein